MSIALIQYTDTSESLAYKIAHVVFAETGGKSLKSVEALTSMIKNLSNKTGVAFQDIINTSDMFSHKNKSIDITSRHFQMCLRVARRMLNGVLPDKCFGATMFHHVDTMPQWSVSRGYIADIDGILFYL